MPWELKCSRIRSEKPRLKWHNHDALDHWNPPAGVFTLLARCKKSPWSLAEGIFCLRAHIPLGFIALHIPQGSLPANSRLLKPMAHQFSTGVFLHNKPAWHQLGVVIDGELPAREAFRIAKADFQVAGGPVFDQDMRAIPG